MVDGKGYLNEFLILFKTVKLFSGFIEHDQEDENEKEQDPENEIAKEDEG